MAFPNEVSKPSSSAVNYYVWRRSAMFMIMACHIVAVIALGMDASSLAGQSRGALAPAQPVNTTSFVASCTAVTSSSCDSLCSNVTDLVQAAATTAVADAEAARMTIVGKCDSPAERSNSLDSLRMGLDITSLVSLLLGWTMLGVASCKWADFLVSARFVVVALVLRVALPYLSTFVPWAEALDITCSEFRLYMASMLVAPQVPLLLTTIPGIIRASRLLATIAPRSALPRLVLRVMPAIYFLTTWVPVALVVHAMGNVLLLVGLALFTASSLFYIHASQKLEDASTGRSANAFMSCYTLLADLLYAAGVIIVFVFAALKVSEKADTVGSLPAALPRLPTATYFVAYGFTYIGDYFLITVVAADYLCQAVVALSPVRLLKKERQPGRSIEASLADSDVSALISVLFPQRVSADLDLGISQGHAGSMRRHQNNPAFHRGPYNSPRKAPTTSMAARPIAGGGGDDEAGHAAAGASGGGGGGTSGADVEAGDGSGVRAAATTGSGRRQLPRRGATAGGRTAAARRGGRSYRGRR